MQTYFPDSLVTVQLVRIWCETHAHALALIIFPVCNAVTCRVPLRLEVFRHAPTIELIW